MAGDSGGFFPPNPLLSPPPSSVASTTDDGDGILPRPRNTPLRSGSAKESAYINTVDARILVISRRFAKRVVQRQQVQGDGSKGNNAEAREPDQDAVQTDGPPGYTNFRQAAKDISRVIDLVWVSGTPSLQVQYLLSLALLVLTYLSAFPPSPKSMFRVLHKLDYAFASLVNGRDVETGMTLPGFSRPGVSAGISGISATDKVRIQSLTERTRVAVVEAMNASDFEVVDGDASDYEDMATETEGEGDYQATDADMDDVFNLAGDEMEVARVYDRTLVELGDTLGAA